MLRPFLLLAAAAALAGCAALPRDHGYTETAALVEARGGHSPAWQAAEAPPAFPAGTLGADDAVRIAFANAPRVRETYAELGFTRAEVEEARRLANPVFGFSHLDVTGGGTQITRSLSATFASLLMLPTRSRLARADFERASNQVAAELLELATDTEVAWYRAVGAAQVAAMRDLVARSAEHSAALAQRFFDAGNIPRLQLEQEHAAATSARITALRAHVEALRARAELAALMGVPSDADFRLGTGLPAPLATHYDSDELLAGAMANRLDLAAAEQGVRLREDGLDVANHWRWLGDVELGYERESEPDGSTKRGPTLELALPIFDQGQGSVARADAQLQRQRARRDALRLRVHNDARLGAQRVALAREIAERYRTALIPRREAIVARTQENVNFMLQGVFELIAARQDEFDAYQEYLEAVRDYWIARAELRGIAGGRLPDDDAARQATLGVDAVLPTTPAEEATDHSHHDMDHGDKP